MAGKEAEKAYVALVCWVHGWHASLVPVVGMVGMAGILPEDQALDSSSSIAEGVHMQRPTIVDIMAGLIVVLLPLCFCFTLCFVLFPTVFRLLTVLYPFPAVFCLLTVHLFR